MFLLLKNRCRIFLDFRNHVLKTFAFLVGISQGMVSQQIEAKERENKVHLDAKSEQQSDRFGVGFSLGLMSANSIPLGGFRVEYHLSTNHRIVGRVLKGSKTLEEGQASLSIDTSYSSMAYEIYRWKYLSLFAGIAQRTFDGVLQSSKYDQFVIGNYSNFGSEFSVSSRWPILSNLDLNLQWVGLFAPYMSFHANTQGFSKIEPDERSLQKAFDRLCLGPTLQYLIISLAYVL